MTRILLDTSAYSGFTGGDREITESIRTADRVYFNPVVLGELRAGFIRGTRQKHNEAALVTFLGSPRVEVVVIDEETSQFYAAIYASLREFGKPIPTSDMWIAATAMQHGLRLATYDDHFRRVAQIIVDHYA